MMMSFMLFLFEGQWSTDQICSSYVNLSKSITCFGLNWLSNQSILWYNILIFYYIFHLFHNSNTWLSYYQMKWNYFKTYYFIHYIIRNRKSKWFPSQTGNMKILLICNCLIFFIIWRVIWRVKQASFSQELGFSGPAGPE